MIPHSRPVFGQPFAKAVQQVVASGHTAMGDLSAALEERVAGLLERKSAVAVDSGTSAITLSLRALARQRSVKRVGIPSYTCSSVLYAVLAAGCEPVCMECGHDLRLLADQALGQAASLDAVVLVHPFGMVEPLAAASWSCPVIEDIAQAAGAALNGRPVGSFGDLAIASFYATKPWGGAYGGIVAANDSTLSEAVRSMRDPDGKTALQDYAGHHQLSDLHAAMASVRLDVADEEQRARKAHAFTMGEWFRTGEVLPIAGLYNGNFYRYIIRTKGQADGWVKKLQELGIGAARPVQVPIHRLLNVEAAGAESAWQNCVSIPLLADASDTEMRKIREAINVCMS